MGKKLYVGSISFNATEESLRELFSGIGEVESVKLITDRDTGLSKGFGFVEMSSDEDAKKAIEQLNGKTFMERALIVNEARPQQQRERRDFGGRGGGGGFGQGRGTGYGRGRR
ncbi:MAG: RNA-binding protein [Nitrospirae bacterium]|jgi:cold-inducible RNA-binding protein|nr:RNA-binding protein [Nitrospirota bacterium]